MFLFESYHHESKKKWRDPDDRLEHSQWPIEWKTIHIKRYERFVACALPKPRSINQFLSETIVRRTSERSYACEMTIEQLSDLLFYSCGENDATRDDGVGSRVYASAGARYPTEVYVMILKPIESLARGLYHYDVSSHALVVLLSDLAQEDVHHVFMYPESMRAQCVLVFTTVFERSAIKYKELAYRQALLEVGGIATQATLVATALGVGSVSMSGFDDEALESLLDIDGTTESVVHVVVAG
jgi:SagB-type dehydrogenase family enzyme